MCRHVYVILDRVFGAANFDLFKSSSLPTPASVAVAVDKLGDVVVKQEPISPGVCMLGKRAVSIKLEPIVANQYDVLYDDDFEMWDFAEDYGVVDNFSESEFSFSQTDNLCQGINEMNVYMYE